MLVIFAYTACKVNLSCKVNRISMTRRAIKQKSRSFDLFFSIIFVILTALLLFSFLKDTRRKECQTDTRFEKMNQVAGVLMFLSVVQSLILLTRSIFICNKYCKAKKRRHANPA